MNLQSIAQLLDDQGVAKQGKNLFVNYMPPEHSGVLLREPPNGTTIDWELPGYLRTSFQMIVRDMDYLAGRQFAITVGNALMTATKLGLTVGEVHFNYIRPRTEPVSFAPTPGRMTEHLVYIDCCYVDATYGKM